jgi:hypothetical protein
MPEMTRDEKIEGLLHEITRAHCHLEDAERDLGVVADDLDELMKALDPSAAQLLGPFARGLQVHLNELEQFDEAIRVTLTSLVERLGSLTNGRAAPDHRGDGYTPKNRGGSTDIR